jgi:hypothetical protein
MNIEEFKVKYAAYRDADQIQIDCEHPNHNPSEQPVQIGKQPAKRNILKSEGKGFICRKCMMVHDNPTNRTVKTNRQTDEIIEVFCPCEDHEGEPSRQMKKSAYFGVLAEPFLQVCRSCSQRGKEIPEEQRERIRLALTGIKRSDEFKQKLSFYMKNNPEGIERAKKILGENHCNMGMLGKHHSEEHKKHMSELMSGRVYTEEHRQNISEGRKKMLDEQGGFTDEHRERISQATVRQYINGFNPKTHHISGWHKSTKVPNGEIFFRSSYEKKAFLKLDDDRTVDAYRTEAVTVEYYKPNQTMKSNYIIDLIVYYTDGSKKLIEVKPESWLKDTTMQKKLDAGKMKAAEMDMAFEVWTEMNLFGHVYNKRNMDEFIYKILSGEV